MKVLLIGHGTMGKLFYDLAMHEPDMEVVGMVGHFNYLDSSIRPDVIVDFSHPDNLERVLEYAMRAHLPLVIGTTGYDFNQQNRIHAFSRKVPILQAANFSLGITLMKQLIEMMTPILKEFDIEILESHHAKKIDAPSGTTHLLLDSIKKSRNFHEAYGRKGECYRDVNEIGIHSIRGGSLAGDHKVCYLGENESLTISHTSSSKKIFIQGAFKAIRFIVNKDCGHYSMEDVLFYSEDIWKQKKYYE